MKENINQDDTLPQDHPRYESLEFRHKIIEGMKDLVVAEAGLIAHGRGECFDYIIGEKTNKFAEKAIKAAVALLLISERPIISVNGNTAALVPQELVKLSNTLSAPLEINIFYGKEGRVEAITDVLLKAGALNLLGTDETKMVEIEELSSNRRRVDPNGIKIADTIFVPLKDGDRTETLKKMIEKGLEQQEIIKILEEKLTRDHCYESGQILGSMCTDPLDFGKKVYLKYMHKNLGDPGLFPSTSNLEDELISEIGDLYGGKNIVGTFTTGGSEANIIAMRIARNLRLDIKKPEIIVPASAHASFDKGEDFLGIKIRKAELKANYELDMEHYESLINENTCGVVGIAGTTSLGLIDPIEEIEKLIEGKNIFFHVDAAFGGFVLPFLEKLKYKVPAWDFRVKSVNSITSDPHKMGFGIIPTGGFLIRDPTVLQKMGFEIPYLAGGGFKHFHIVGTRPGGTVIAFWAIMKHLGVEGYKKIVKECMDNTDYLVNRLSEIKGIKSAHKPEMNVVGITTEDGESICEIDDKLREKNWMAGKFLDFNLIRVAVMPHVTKDHLERFCNDLEEIVKELHVS